MISRHVMRNEVLGEMEEWGTLPLQKSKTMETTLIALLTRDDDDQLGDGR